MSSRRRGVASIVGTVVFILVFMLALGSLAYASGLQAQASQAELQAQGAASRRGGESLAFVNLQGLSAMNEGTASVEVNHVVLRYPNGTVYAIPASASIAPGMESPVAPLIPPGTCYPGTATCQSKYGHIISGNPSGSSVGLVSSMGNVFWYTYSGSQSGWASVSFSTPGTWTVPGGVTEAYVVCIGGGGGGGGSGGATYLSGASGSGGGGGGGVGSLAEGFVILSGVSSVPVAVGLGGAGGTAGGYTATGGKGGDGGPSSFGNYVACGGGGGGGGSYYNVNGGSGSSCAPSSPADGGAGDGVPGGVGSLSGVAANALQQTMYGGGGGGGSSIYTPPGAGSYSDSMVSGAEFTSTPGSSGFCALGGGGGSASPFGNGGSGGNAATTCGSGQSGGYPGPSTGAGGGGAGGAYSPSSSCGTRAGSAGGSGGSGAVIVYYEG
ncbi:MAG: hypothetical protein KGI38_07730 [Thaumarchaeota archaeon]|nr:hypothetical protein [Nitrososphaerota archaeon]